VPEEWLSWFAIKEPYGIAYIQDTVHIAVKLKARLLNLSVDLFFGKYIVDIFIQLWKVLEKMSTKDVNHKYQHNYDAVVLYISQVMQSKIYCQCKRHTYILVASWTVT